MAFLTELGPNFLGVIPVVQLEGLAESSPLVVHLRDFLVEFFSILLFLFLLLLFNLIKLDSSLILSRFQLHNGLILLFEVFLHFILSFYIIIRCVSQLNSTVLVFNVYTSLELIEFSDGAIVLVGRSKLFGFASDNIANTIFFGFSCENLSFLLFLR